MNYVKILAEQLNLNHYHNIFERQVKRRFMRWLPLQCDCWQLRVRQHIDGLVQESRNSSVLAMELHLSYTNQWVK